MENRIGPAFKKRMTSLEAIIEIAKNMPEVSSFSFAIYIPAGIKEFIPDRIDRHNSPEKIMEVESRWLANENPYIFFSPIYDIISDGRHHFGFCSKIKLHGNEKDFHLPLMDFRCRNTPANLEKVRSFLEKIGERKGLILDSGHSFHYYGLNMLSRDEWRIFMAKCLLSDLTDRRLLDIYYIGHCLWDGFAMLRVSNSVHYPKMPTVISILGEKQEEEVPRVRLKIFGSD